MVLRTGLGPADEYGCDWADGLGLLFRLLFLLFFLNFFFLLFNIVTLGVLSSDLFDNSDGLRLWGWGLQVCKGVFVRIDVPQREQLVRVVRCRENVHVAVHTAGCEVLVLQLSERHDLADFLGMGKWENVHLVLLVKAIDNEVAAAQTGNKQIFAFATDRHRVQRLVRLIGVSSTLKVLVPELQGGVQRGSQKFVLVDVDNAGNFVLMRAVGFELLLHDHKVVTAFTHLSIKLKFIEKSNRSVVKRTVHLPH